MNVKFNPMKYNFHRNKKLGEINRKCFFAHDGKFNLEVLLCSAWSAGVLVKVTGVSYITNVGAGLSVSHNGSLISQTNSQISSIQYRQLQVTKGWSLKFRNFVFGNNYLNSSPNSKSKVSFEICSFWGFQTWPYFWYLAK